MTAVITIGPWDYARYWRTLFGELDAAEMLATFNEVAPEHDLSQWVTEHEARIWRDHGRADTPMPEEWLAFRLRAIEELLEAESAAASETAQ